MNENNKVIIIYDCPWEVCDKTWLYNELKKTGKVIKRVEPKCLISQVELRGAKGKILAILLTLSECVKARLMSKKGDVVVCWSQWSGLLFNLLPGSRRRKVISFNWLTPTFNKKTRFIYANALNNPNFVAIINSRDNRKKLQDAYGCRSNRNIYYLADVFDDRNTFAKPQYIIESPYGFIGGIANRDWKLFFEVAKRCVNITFHAVASKTGWDNNMECPDNVMMQFDLTEEAYKEIMQKAYVVLIPLKEDKVSGLVNILKSVQLGKIVLTTELSVTSDYFPEHLKGYLAKRGDAAKWCENVNAVFTFGEEEYSKYVEDMQAHIKDRFSPQAAGKELRRILEEHSWRD